MENIENAQNNSNDVEKVFYAGFWRRFVGWLIDILIIIIITHWVNILVSNIIKTPIPDTINISAIFTSLFPILLIIFLIDFIVIALYYCLFEASSLQATFGKYVVGIKITDMSNSKISYGKAFLRRIYSLLSIISIFIGYFVSGFTEKKQTFHDMLAKTIVVISKPRKTIILVGIIIITLVIGILSDKYIGAGFHINFNSSVSNYETESESQYDIFEDGDKVDPELQKAIIDAYVSGKSIYLTRDSSLIRDHLLSGVAASEQEQINKISDSEIIGIASTFNTVTDQIDHSLLETSNSRWYFDEEKTTVKIKFKNTPYYIGLTYINDHWVF